MSYPKRIAVFISGNGSNLQALIDHLPSLKYHLVVVISNKPNVYGLTRAEKVSIPTHVLMKKDFQSYKEPRLAYDQALADLVQSYEPDLIILAGFLHILSSIFLDRFPWKVINLHPALPNTFIGLNAIERAWQAYQTSQTPTKKANEPLVPFHLSPASQEKESNTTCNASTLSTTTITTTSSSSSSSSPSSKLTKTGVMVHYVIPEVDLGEPLIVEEVPFIGNESLDQFETRMHSVEHEVIVKAVDLFFRKQQEKEKEIK